VPDRYDDIHLRRGVRRPESVQRLQADLRELGFAVVGVADGVFGRRTEWALREFQIYARQPGGAREASSGEPVYADRLVPAPNNDRFLGPVSGTADAETRRLLEVWLDGRRRCPVVVEAWRMRAGKRNAVVAQNLWLADDLKDQRRRMYARDLSDYWADGAGDSDGRIVVGEYTRALEGGPLSKPPRHVWSSAEILPETIYGASFDGLSPAQRSTFRVLRAVSEVECLGFFDSVNAYDNAFLSAGPCHWTLGLASVQGNVSDAEMPAFWALLEERDPAGFDKLLAATGVRPDAVWGQDGSSLRNASAAKYDAGLRLQTADGTYRRAGGAAAEWEWFRGWHWFYRLVMAGRTLRGYRRAMGEMTRIRLRDVRAARFADGPTIGEVFTSEKAAALILRWHVRFPAHVVRSGRAGSGLRAALGLAREARPDLDWDAPPADWTDAHESALIDGLLARAAVTHEGFSRTMQTVARWPDWNEDSNPRNYLLDPDLGPLSAHRRSFDFDSEAL